MASLNNLNFDNSYSALGEDFSVRLDPDGFENPTLVSWNDDAAKLLNLDQQPTDDDINAFFGGQKNLPGSEPISMVYAGHQFGGFSHQLGDGRGILLGEVINEKQERWDLHLKGAGLTPFSRMGDGRAVLRSVIREYLGGEAMHHLGIASSRALSIVTSDLPVRREEIESGTMMLRLSRSHIRFGHFEYFFHAGKSNQLQRLFDYTLTRHFPDIADQENKGVLFFEKVSAATAKMIAEWQAVGFTHGVMNTDNLSIIGDTFDYGPYGFMDDYNPAYIPNHSDTTGRYSYEQQPSIGHWNLRCLALSLQDFVSEDEASAVLENYRVHYRSHYISQMLAKFGLEKETADTVKIMLAFLDLLEESKADYSLSFRTLSSYSIGNNSLDSLIPCDKKFRSWADSYDALLSEEDLSEQQRHKKMKQVNPCYVLRNYLLQQAIEKAENNDYSEIDTLLKLIRQPYVEQKGMEAYQQPPPNWGKHLIISCSS